MKELLSRRAALKTMFAGGAIASIPVAGRLYAGGGTGARVAEAEIPGDGETPVADALQRFLNRIAESGGGIVALPPGRFVLEKTLLIPSRVHLIGQGAATVLTGYRPDGIDGFALVANDGIVTARGYEGARNFSVQNLAIDSPRTNGIVLVHADNAYFSHIYGVDSYHHHFDIAGSRNIVTENVFLTGRSGTAPYQVDGSPFNNNIWDGEKRVAPIRDGTPNDGIFLSDSVIRPTNRPNHGIHLHRRGGRNIFFDSVVVENVENGIYRDRNCNREDVVFANVAIRNVSLRGVHFEPSGDRDRRVTFQNVSIVAGEIPTGLDYQACEDLTLQNVAVETSGGGGHFLLEDIEGGSGDNLIARGGGRGTALHLRRCRSLFLSRISARALPATFRFESSANIQYSGLIALDGAGEPVPPVIHGRECLARWQGS